MNTDKIYAESIAKEYAVQDTSKLVALKKLDKRAKAPANIFALCFGVAMTLVLGTGMCYVMGVLGSGAMSGKVIGIILGVIGAAGMIANYPIYKKLRESGKKKYAFEIMTLAKEISEAAV